MAEFASPPLMRAIEFSGIRLLSDCPNLQLRRLLAQLASPSGLELSILATLPVSERNSEAISFGQAFVGIEGHLPVHER
jgi:hypothetical protein